MQQLPHTVPGGAHRHRCVVGDTVGCCQGGLEHLLKVDPDEDRVRGALENELPASLGYLEQETAGRDHLVGGEFTLADIATCAQLVGLRLGGEDLDAGRWPNLARYLETNLARPSFKALLAEEGIA